MASLFKRKSKKDPVSFHDLDGQPLQTGDIVLSLRYDLGECRIIETEKGKAYESLASGEIVSYIRMIDAASGYQKVRKKES